MALFAALNALLVYAFAGTLTSAHPPAPFGIACAGGWAENLPTTYVRLTVYNPTASGIAAELRPADTSPRNAPNHVEAFALGVDATVEVVLRDPGRGDATEIRSNGRIHLVSQEIARRTGLPAEPVSGMCAEMER